MADSARLRSLRNDLRLWAVGTATATLLGVPLLALPLGDLGGPVLVVLALLFYAGLAAALALWVGWLAALARLRAQEDADARRERRRADVRWNAAAGVGLLFVGGGSVALRVVGSNAYLVLLGLAELGCAAAIQLALPRRRDPWAYDPDLDGPGRGSGAADAAEPEALEDAEPAEPAGPDPKGP